MKEEARTIPNNFPTFFFDFRVLACSLFLPCNYLNRKYTRYFRIKIWKTSIAQEEKNLFAYLFTCLFVCLFVYLTFVCLFVLKLWYLLLKDFLSSNISKDSFSLFN